MTLLISAILQLQAQNISGKDFWVTFASISNMPPSSPAISYQIRIASGNKATTGNIHFTSLGISVPFALGAHEVYTYSLTTPQIEAVYNTTTGITDYSVHITSVDSVTVYTYYGISNGYGDATNILPTTTLGTEYYQISHAQYVQPDWHTMCYAVVATQNNTQLFHNGELVETLNKGQVYFRTTNEEMTGTHITANHPVAFFSFNQAIHIVASAGYGQQQFPPTSTWGKTFFVPNSPHTLDRVRIVVTQDGTNITQIAGGTLQTDIPGAQTTLNNLQAGNFIELKISSDGCYIKAEKPVGVCSFLSGDNHLSVCPSLCWIPAVEQTIPHTLIAPFVITATQPQLSNHYAFICTPTADREDTRVSIGGAPPTILSGGSWIENAAANMSFYRMPLYQGTASYYFSNPASLIVLCYGDGPAVSYYYPVGFAMRNLSAAFTANNIPYNELSDHIFCEHDITFVANIEGIHPNPGSLKWYIDGVEEDAKRDSLKWSKNFATGSYEIKMTVLFEDESTETYEDTLKIGCAAVFYANNVYYENLPDITFNCKNVSFRAAIDNLHPDPENLKWYIDDEEYVSARDSLEWSKDFETGEYEIVMWARLANDEIVTTPPKLLKMQIAWIRIRNIRTH